MCLGTVKASVNFAKPLMTTTTLTAYAQYSNLLGVQLFLQWRTWLDKSCGSGQSVRTMAQDLLNQFILGQHDALLLFASLNTWDSYMLRKLLVNFTCFLMYELSKIALDMCWPWDRSCQAHWVTSNYQNVIYQNNPRDTILIKPYLQMIPRKS